ncbi:MAG: hypothetical protein FWD17_14395, partial [Polyangiaceae bacterium]|nr:hypothetical protein [Polyangiaceae bacterium]
PLLNGDMTARYVLQQIAQQLGYSTLGLRQVDAMVGSLLAHLAGAGASFPRAFLNDLAALGDDARSQRVEEALERVLEIWQDLDESYLRRLLSVPFVTPASQRATMAWLAGRECDDVQLRRIGVSAALDEPAVVPALRALAAVASLAAPIVVVFDQLENLVDGQDSRSRLLAYANLASELVDSVRGIVLVHMAIDTEWSRAIDPALGAGHRSRIAMQVKTLALPTPEQREELLRRWAERIPEPQAPFPWPFGERRVARWCRAPGVTPRMLLIECRNVLEQGSLEDEPVADAAPITSTSDDLPDASSDALPDEWEKQLAAARRMLDELAAQSQCLDAARLCDGLATATEFAPGLTVKANARESAQLSWRTGNGVIRMAVLDQSSPRSLGACLARLATIAETEPVWAVRERAHDLAPTWKDTLAKRAAFLSKPSARWLALERDETARLLALAGLVAAAGSRDVTDTTGRPIALDVVRAWISRNLGIPSWPLLAALAGGATATVAETPDPVSDVAVRPTGLALMVLRRLRVASLDRLLREVARLDARVTRHATLVELQRAASVVHWIGSEIVCLREEP